MMRLLIIFTLIQYLIGLHISKGAEISPSTPITIRVASYNIRYASANDEKTGNAWVTRKEHVANLMLDHHFDIVGTQEGDSTQINDLCRLMPAFGFVSANYGGKNNKLHTATIFYKKDKFEAIDSGVFWLSETPDVESIGWDASDTRLCQWVRFREIATSRTFYFFNTHFYWRKQVSKEKSGPLLAEKLSNIAHQSPAIVTGDFNSTANSFQIKAIQKIAHDAFSVSNTPPKGPNATGFSGGIFKGSPKSRIDYIFVSKTIDVLDYTVIDDTYRDNRYPSDHLPVTSTVRF